MPRVSTQQNSLEFWSGKLGSKADTLLLTTVQIEALNVTNQKRPWAFQDVTQDSIADRKRISAELEERLKWLEERLASGRYKEARSGLMTKAEEVIASGFPTDELRVLTKRADLRCIPSKERLFAPASSPNFDRNQCSGLIASHLVRVLMRSGRWYYVHGAHSVGWVYEPQWTPPLSVDKARLFRDGKPRLVFTARTSEPATGEVKDLGESYPLVSDSEEAKRLEYISPTVSGLKNQTSALLSGIERGWLPFTRRNLLRLAFSQHRRGYGWGESKGLTDCSRLLLDAFRPFGIFLGRHSSEQARSGSAVFDLSSETPTRKRDIIRHAAKTGVVLLYMRGHIMLYLGDHQGKDYALSAIHDFRTRCSNQKGDTDAFIGKVVVSDLLVGVNTQKGSFLDRLERATVFGQDILP